jgi:crotonobetainyl-CoA:carnitine CoA-transferase CaiB-like acyl-CoA transferase
MRFSTFAVRRENADELRSILGGIFITRPTAEWILRLQAAGVPCGPVNTVAEALAEPQTDARQMILEVEHERWGAVREVATAVRAGPFPTAHRRAPRRGEDAPAILAELLGYQPAEIARLREAGAFG